MYVPRNSNIQTFSSLNRLLLKLIQSGTSTKIKKPKFELILDVMVVFVILKNEEDAVKNEVARVATTFSHYN